MRRHRCRLQVVVMRDGSASLLPCSESRSSCGFWAVGPYCSMWAVCHLRAEVLWLDRMVFMIVCRRSVDFGACCVDAARVTLCGVVRCRYSRIDVASSSAARSRAFVILVVGRPWISWVACVASMVDHWVRTVSSLGVARPSCEHRSRMRRSPSVSSQTGEAHCTSNHISCTVW